MEDLQQMLGQQAMQDFKNLKQVMVLLNNSGYLMPKGEHSQLSPKGVRRIGQLALRDIFQSLLKDRAGSHTTDHRGVTEIRPDETKTYAYGDPLNLNLVGTLKKALARKPGVPLQLSPDDFEIYENDYGSSSSTVLCLDMSWSMSWEGRFAAAKKVAMAMETLIRSKFPRDFFAIVGFFTRAVELKLKDLPEASWNMGDPFTNLAGRTSPRIGHAESSSIAQSADHRDHRRSAHRLLPEQTALLRMAAVIRRDQHARRAGNPEGSRAGDAQGHHHQHLHA